MNIFITGWKPGFNKIQFGALLKECCGFSLSESKRIVDLILERNQVSITVIPEFKEYFYEKAPTLGVIFQEDKF